MTFLLLKKECLLAEENLNGQSYVKQRRWMVRGFRGKKTGTILRNELRVGPCHGSNPHGSRDRDSRKAQSARRMRLCTDRHTLTTHCFGMGIHHPHVHAGVIPATGHVRHGHPHHGHPVHFNTGYALWHRHRSIAHPGSNKEQGQHCQRTKVAAKL